VNIAGIGPAELLLVLIVALVVLGPQKLPEIARDLGKSIAKWRQAIDEIQTVADVPMKEIKEVKEALDPAAMEKKMQESVQRVVAPPNQDRAGNADQIAEQVETPEKPEVNN
jgi:Tat protein translocase TatB subunit